MATCSSILAQKIPWTEEPGGLHTVHGARELDTTDQLNTAITSTKNIEEGARVKIMSPALTRLFEVSTQVGDCWKYVSKAQTESGSKRWVSSILENQIKPWELKKLLLEKFGSRREEKLGKNIFKDPY